MTFGTGETLDEIVRRSKLPIHVECEWDIPCWWISAPGFFVLPLERDEAVGAYLRLVSKLSNPGISSPGCESSSAGSSAPEGAGW